MTGLAWTVAAIAALVALFMWAAAVGERQLRATEAAALDEQAGDWGEPARAQVEAAMTLPPLDAPDEAFEAWARSALGIVPADPTPPYTAVAAKRLRDELDNDAAVAAWMKEGA